MGPDVLRWLPLALLFACSAGDGASDAGGPATFVAYETNFDGFHSWSNKPAVALPGAPGDGLHDIGPLQVYWNEAPPHGATSFPVGTIIVKESEQVDPTQRIIFAMVKRGGGFNSDGANNWEWFSLQNNADGTEEILWRGVVAPTGEVYANQPAGNCNGCHMASTNDSVWDSALQLSSF